MKPIIISNGRMLVGNPAVEIIGDILIEDGKISAIGTVGSHAEAEIIDAKNSLVLPGLVDTHTHYIAGANAGYSMLPLAGVTTALDAICNGTAPETIQKTPTGLNILFLYLIKPGLTVKSVNPKDSELSQVLDKALKAGAFGIKLAGAHFPITPDATGRLIALCARRKIPLMIHAGTTENTDDINGLLALEALADGNPLHIAHVNSYCLGVATGDSIAEAVSAINMLKRMPHVVSESILSPLDCMGTRMINGVPESLVMINWLEQSGFPGTYKGLEAAIAAEVFRVSGPKNGVFDFLDRDAGLARCRERDGQVTIGISRHTMSKNIVVATAKRDNGDFVVDAISTDGGIVPRNVTLDYGLKLVNAGVFTMSEFVHKACSRGAWMLGLSEQKGQLSVGYDADIVVADPVTGQAQVVISNGLKIMDNGIVYNNNNKLYSLKQGVYSGLAASKVEPEWVH